MEAVNSGFSVMSSYKSIKINRCGRQKLRFVTVIRLISVSLGATRQHLGTTGMLSSNVSIAVLSHHRTIWTYIQLVFYDAKSKWPDMLELPAKFYSFNWVWNSFQKPFVQNQLRSRLLSYTILTLFFIFLENFMKLKMLYLLRLSKSNKHKRIKLSSGNALYLK